MKVLWFSNTPANGAEYLHEGPVGGGWLKALDKALQKKVELHVAFYYPKLNHSFKYGDTIYYPISIKNWKFQTILGLFRDYLIDKQDIKKYLEVIYSIKPDIIHIHGTENPFGCIIPYVNIPVVISIQGCITVYFHKFSNDFNIRNLRKSKYNYGLNLRLFLRHKSFLRVKREFKKMSFREQNNLSLAENIIGRTSWDKRIASVLALKSEYFHSDELLRDIFFKYMWKYQKKSKLIIHTTTGDSPYKGFETICESLFLLNSVLDIEVLWQIAGIGSRDRIVKVTRDKLKRRFPETGLIYLGEIGENELVQKMCDADVFVSASHIENSSNSLCEALLMGMPCIATFAGGTGSLLKDNEEGILIQDGDPWSMTGAILELHRNPDLAIQYGRKARERALLRHNPERLVTELINIYEQIILKKNVELP